jgi:hypothetical protein
VFLNLLGRSIILWQDRVNVDLLPCFHRNNERLLAGVDKRRTRRERRTSLRLKRLVLLDAEAGKLSVVIVSTWQRLDAKAGRVLDGNQLGTTNLKM